MDDIDSKRAILFGFSEGCAMSTLFVATYPERGSKLILFGGFTRPVAATRPEWILEHVKAWGTGALINALLPSMAGNLDAVAQFAKFERLSASPGAIKVLLQMNALIDVRSVCPVVRVPTLVLHRQTDALILAERGRDLAAQIPDAKYIEYPGSDHAFWSDEVEAMLGDIQEFVTGERDSAAIELERVLATVLFTDIVDSTRSVAEAGDHTWRRLLDSHDQLAKQMVEKYRGSLIKTTGDGILATFDGPGRAVRCALALGTATRQIGLPSRAGLHTGEIEIRGRDIGGIAVHAASRHGAVSVGRSSRIESRHRPGGRRGPEVLETRFA
jgi:dienelactone hydrolase